MLRNLATTVWIVTAPFLLSESIDAQSQRTEAEGYWTERNELAGDAFGLREAMRQLGATLNLKLIADTSYLIDGGLDDRIGTRTLIDLSVGLDLERTLGWSRTSVFLELYSQSGRDGSLAVGDIQSFSNIDESDVNQLAQLWIEHETAGGDLRVKLGKVDANTEFASADFGALFLNSSSGYSPTITPFPSYPHPTTSLNAFVQPATGWEIRIGIYNGEDGGTVSGRRGLSADFDEAFFIGQLDRTWDGGNALGRGRLAVGAWHHTGEFARFDSGTEGYSEGAYALLEQSLAAVDTFFQWGTSDNDVSIITNHFAAGVISREPIAGYFWRTGLYVSLAELSDEPGAAAGADELVIEFANEFELTPAIRIKPDLQYIVDPSGSKFIDDALVATLRIEISL